MCNNNDSNDQIPLKLYFSKLEQFSTLKLLFFYSKNGLNELEKFSIVEQLLFASKYGLSKNELIVMKHFIENPYTTIYYIRKKQNLKKEKVQNLSSKYKRQLLEKKLLIECIHSKN